MSCLLEVGSDIGRYQMSNFEKDQKSSETNNISNKPLQPPQPPYQSQLDNHEAESVCNANSLGFNDYLIKSNSLQHANSFDKTLTNPNISQNGELNIHEGGPNCNTTLSNIMYNPINQTTSKNQMSTKFNSLQHTTMNKPTTNNNGQIRSQVKSNNMQHLVNGDFIAPHLDPTQYQKSKKENGDRLAQIQQICVNEKNKIVKNVRTTSTYGATDKFGHKFPWVKSDKKWRQTIHTAKIVLDTNVKLVTSDIEQFF